MKQLTRIIYNISNGLSLDVHNVGYKAFIRSCSVLIICASFQASAKQVLENLPLTLPSLNVEQELNNSVNGKLESPARYAVTSGMSVIDIMAEQSNQHWQQLPNGDWLWKLHISAENAMSLDLSFKNVYLPPSAQLSIFDYSNKLRKGPYTGKDNKSHKQLWPGPIAGDELTIELLVSNKYKSFVSLNIDDVYRGFVDILPQTLPVRNNSPSFWENQKSTVTTQDSSCNVDVACSVAEQWQDQVRSVARYTYQDRGSLFTCTGQLVNNTRNNGQPLFLTANHCVNNNQMTPSINILWNYQSDQCRTLNSSNNNTPISTSSFTDTQSGASLIATYKPSDMSLLLLDENPPVEYNVYYSGWDRSDNATQSAVSIHHPNFNAKRISLENNPTNISGNADYSSGDRTHLRVTDWDLGTTEGGSSGAGIWNSEHLLVGQLHGGYAACGNDEADWFGRLFTSWQGGNTSQTRLSDWLDPLQTNQQQLSGFDSTANSCANMSIEIQASDVENFTGIEQVFTANIQGGSSPYSYEWNIDQDEYIDGNDENIKVTYAQEYIGNISVKVTDANQCSQTITEPLVIQAPKITLQTQEFAYEICGNNDDKLDPGERWYVPISLTNEGPQTAQNLSVVFRKKIDASSQNDFNVHTAQSTAFIYLDTPALYFSNLRQSQTVDEFVIFGISPEATCGAPVVLEMQAAVFDSGFNQTNQVFLTSTIGGSGICEVVGHCQNQLTNDINPTNGLWDNSWRSGNGLDMYSIQNEQDSIENLVFLQYTAKQNKHPIWYITNQDQVMQNNQSVNELAQINYTGGFQNSQRVDTVVGYAMTTFLNKNYAIQTRIINGFFSAEKLTPLVYGSTPNEQRTGLWYNPTESGWGLSIGTQSDSHVALSYLYDNQGNPYWLLGSGDNSKQVINNEMYLYQTFCPHCPRVTPNQELIGQLDINYQSNTQGTIVNMDINNSSNSNVTNWKRLNLPISLITHPIIVE